MICAELIDIAEERNHPQTRVAWEHARQAAKSVGFERREHFLSLSRGLRQRRLSASIGDLDQRVSRQWH